jgi:mannosyltransferase OCH1-like enzyme
MVFWQSNPPARQEHSDKTNRLPVIVQFWHCTPPTEIAELMDTWRQSRAEGFEYLRFDADTARDFIRTHFDRRTEEAFLACAVPAMKADFFRICALLVRPGIYVDADTRRSGASLGCQPRDEQSASLIKLYQQLERGLLFQREERIANGFIIVKHECDPLLLAILAKATHNIEHRTSNNVYVVTGPGIATTFLKELGFEHEYFQKFEFWTQESLLPYMKLVGKLPYKQTGDHWVNAQKLGSIFTPESQFRNIIRE